MREVIAMERVSLEYVPTEEQMADVLTKALPTPFVSSLQKQFFIATKNAS